MSEHTCLSKRSQSFSDFKQLGVQKVVMGTKEKPKSDAVKTKNDEAKRKEHQEYLKDLVITKLVIQSARKSERVLSRTSRKIKEMHGGESNPFFKILSDETINFEGLSETEKIKHADGIYKEHLKQTFYSLKVVKNLQKYSALWVKSEHIVLANKFPGRKTLILDLDETLVHCMGQRKGHVSIPIRFPDSRECRAGVNLRPYLHECLEYASSNFEVIVFTASHQFYADAVIDHLDPEKKYFHHRLYRDSCVKYGNFNIKDLRLINRRLQDLIIVDNSVFSFAFQLDNGVPIIPWVNDPLDSELLQLIEYLKIVKELDDVREFNRKLFQLDSFYEDYLDVFPAHNERIN